MSCDPISSAVPHKPTDRSSSGTSAPAAEQPAILKVSQWGGENWILHGFSTRAGGVSQLPGSHSSGGDLNLGYTALDDPEAVSVNRRRFLAGVAPTGEDRYNLVTIRQMHSGLSRRVRCEGTGERAQLWGDGLMTNEPGVLLGIQTADCLPILIADPRRRAVAAFHAGWRGTLKGIVQQGVASMRLEFGSEPEDLTAAIGPGIGSCCFAVGPEVQQLFQARYPYAEKMFAVDGQLRMNLVAANRLQLLAAGLPPTKIHCLNMCTSCNTGQFFSYRAERGMTGRMMAVIGVSPA